MARTADLERADTACPTVQSKRARDVERRRKATAMGSGSGSDFVDPALVPQTMGAIRAQMAPDITAAFRWIKKTARDQDERVWMLATIIGEGGDPHGVQLEVTEVNGDQ